MVYYEPRVTQADKGHPILIATQKTCATSSTLKIPQVNTTPLNGSEHAWLFNGLLARMQPHSPTRSRSKYIDT